MKSINQYLNESLLINEAFQSKKIINEIKKVGEKIKKWYQVHLATEDLPDEDKKELFGEFKSIFKGNYKMLDNTSQLYTQVKLGGIDKLSDNDIVDIFSIKASLSWDDCMKDPNIKKHVRNLFEYANNEKKYDVVMAETDPNGNMHYIFIVTKKDTLKYSKTTDERLDSRHYDKDLRKKY